MDALAALTAVSVSLPNGKTYYNMVPTDAKDQLFDPVEKNKEEAAKPLSKTLGVCWLTWMTDADLNAYELYKECPELTWIPTEPLQTLEWNSTDSRSLSSRIPLLVILQQTPPVALSIPTLFVKFSFQFVNEDEAGKGRICAQWQKRGNFIPESLQHALQPRFRASQEINGKSTLVVFAIPMELIAEIYLVIDIPNSQIRPRVRITEITADFEGVTQHQNVSKNKLTHQKRKRES